MKPSSTDISAYGHSRFWTYQGETLTTGQWAHRLGIERATLYARLERFGWPVEKALTAGIDDHKRQPFGRKPEEYHYVDYEGERLTAGTACRRAGIGEWLVYHRIRKGMTAQEAFDDAVAHKGDKRPKRGLLKFDGRKQSIPAWAKEYGLATSTLRVRLKSGWPVERALTEPPHEKGFRRRAA